MKLVHRERGPELDLDRVRFWTGLDRFEECDYKEYRKRGRSDGPRCLGASSRFLFLCFDSDSTDVHVSSQCGNCFDLALGPEGDRHWMGARLVYSVSAEEVMTVSVLLR